MMQKGNFLILDEPTNHLDLDSKLVLENALIDYPGTILFVSHDRYFINRIATKVIELSKVGNEEFLGDYDYYLEKKQEQAEIHALEQQDQAKTLDAAGEKTNYKIDKEAKKAERQRKRRIEEIEAAMELLETEINECNDLLCDPNVFQDHEKVMEVQTKLDHAQESLDQLLEEWAELEE
jgi:ATP-binding cassette subfamily F protein 3